MSLETDLSLIEKQLTNLRSRISDLGDEIDRQKAKAAGAIGGGVFLLLLALLGAYDLMSGKGHLWSAVRATEAMLYWLTVALAAAGLILLVAGLILTRRRDRKREAQLEALEQEYARLLDSLDSKDSYAS
jgi:hypothetical protein